ADVRRLLVEAAQADVEVFVVPQVEELRAPVGEIRMADMDRRDKSAIPAREFAVERDGLLRLRYQADDRLFPRHNWGNGAAEDRQCEHFLPGHMQPRLARVEMCFSYDGLAWLANAFLSEQSSGAGSPRRNRLNNSCDRAASSRRISRRLPRTRGIA